ncbi:MAG: hypothetical protein AAB262_03860, partial [Elusimicrobiota bacterium]
MEIKILVAGILATGIVIGHFTLGFRMYVVPMLGSYTPLVPRATMHGVFHHLSVFLCLAAAARPAIGLGKVDYQSNQLFVRFLGANYALFAVGPLAMLVESAL